MPNGYYRVAAHHLPHVVVTPQQERPAGFAEHGRNTCALARRHKTVTLAADNERPTDKGPRPQTAIHLSLGSDYVF
jgi:hypothetical protein